MGGLQRSLQQRILAALAFIALFSLIALGIVVYGTQHDALRQQFSAQLINAAESRRAEIVTWLAERKSDLLFLSESQLTQQQLLVLRDPTATPAAQLASREFLQEILGSMQRLRPDYSRVVITDPTGHILVSPDVSLIGRQVVHQAMLQGARAAGLTASEVYIEGIEYAAQTDTYEMCFGRAIYTTANGRAGTKSLLGLLLIATNINKSIYPMLEDWDRGETGSVVLSQLEADGTRILNQMRDSPAEPLTQLLPLADRAVAKPAQLAAQGEEGTKLTIDHLGKEVLTAYRTIPEVGWGLVFKMDTHEIFAPLRTLLLQTFGIALGVLLVATLVSLFIAGTLSRPLRQLVEASHAVGEGNLSVAVASDRLDEIGVLARTFSDMVTKVEHHQRQLQAVNEIATHLLGDQPCVDSLSHLAQATCQLLDARQAIIFLHNREHPCESTCKLLINVADPGVAARGCLHMGWATHGISYGEATAAAFVHDAAPAPMTAAPIYGRDQQLGTLQVLREQPLSHADQNVLTALASYAAVVVENSRLLEQLKRWNVQLEAKVVERTRALEAVNAQLTVLDEMKNEFIYNVSHELRNPITNLKLQLDLLRSNPDSPRRDRYLRAMAKQLDVMAQLVGDMLDLIQLDKMKNQIEFATLDLNQVVNEVTERQRQGIDPAVIHFALELAQRPLYVNGEAIQLQRAINHLVRNAVSYTASGEIYIRTFQQQNRVCVQVRDTGIGIASADLPYIFQRFYRGSNVSQSTIPGSGLGLSLAHEVATLHHGGLDVESQLNRGSTFCLWFPLYDVARGRAVVAY